MSTDKDRVPLSKEVSRLEREVGPHAHHPLLHFQLFEQLKQRNVFRVAVLYLVVCWLILDPVHVIFHMAGVPEWVNRLVLIVMAVGFPAVVIFAWVYEITPEGLKPTVEVPQGQSIRRLTGRRLDLAIIAMLAVALVYFVADKFWISKHFVATQPPAPAQEAAQRAPVAPAVVFAPPSHSIAVLPFVNMSGDKEQEYFSEGLTEELLNSLSRINELQVAARTSSFSFQGEHPDIATVAHKLNVAAVLEGSVRRSAHTVRITAQLVNSVTGFHVWSQTYDRDLGEVLKLQTDIATAVASALKVTLLGDEAGKIEIGGTHNPAAFDAYLRASKAYQSSHDTRDVPIAIAAYSEAIRLDPNYALAFAGRSSAVAYYNGFAAIGAAIHQGSVEGYERAEADARRAIALAPELPQAHLALALILAAPTFDFAHAGEEYERAVALAPGNAEILRASAGFAANMGHFDAAIAAARRAVVLDPLDRGSHYNLGWALYTARRYGEAATAFAEALSLDPDDSETYLFRGLAFYWLGDLESARVSCETKRDYWFGQWCLAVVYDKLGRHADAEAELTRVKEALRDTGAYQYATIYAQWGDRTKALEWLNTAMRLRDTGLPWLKTDPLLDPLRREPHFQAIERELKFPN